MTKKKTKATLSEFVTGKCRWCDDETKVYRDNRLCEDCDSNVIRCSICRTDVHVDDTCRHVYRDQNYEWRGSGAYIDNDVKPALFRLFELMPEGFASDLRVAIKSRRFHTWLIAPLIGGGGTLELNGMPQRDGRWMVHAWGDAMIKIGEGYHAEETADGYRWLVSLYDDKTPKANRAMIAWIDEWLIFHRRERLQDERAALRWADDGGPS